MPPTFSRFVCDKSKAKLGKKTEATTPIDHDAHREVEALNARGPQKFDGKPQKDDFPAAAKPGKEIRTLEPTACHVPGVVGVDTPRCYGKPGGFNAEAFKDTVTTVGSLGTKVLRGCDGKAGK